MKERRQSSGERTTEGPIDSWVGTRGHHGLRKFHGDRTGSVTED